MEPELTKWVSDRIALANYHTARLDSLSAIEVLLRLEEAHIRIERNTDGVWYCPDLPELGGEAGMTRAEYNKLRHTCYESRKGVSDPFDPSRFIPHNDCLKCMARADIAQGRLTFDSPDREPKPSGKLPGLDYYDRRRR